jgi:hypothetical protein
VCLPGLDERSRFRVSPAKEKDLGKRDENEKREEEEKEKEIS